MKERYPVDVTRADIDRIHERLDQIRDDQAAVKTDVAVMGEQMRTMPRPSPRPCSFFQDHVAEHRDSERMKAETKRGILMVVIDKVAWPLFAALVAVLGTVWKLGKGD
jgi:hypothetical protein